MKGHSGEKAAEVPVPADIEEQARAYRERLIEAIAETDDDLLNKFLEGEELSEADLRRGLHGAVTSKSLVPILVGSATHNLGVDGLLDAIVDCLPSPLEAAPEEATSAGTAEELKADPAAPLAALVFKTTADPYVGRLSFVRIYQGTLKSDSPLWNANKSQAERVGRSFTSGERPRSLSLNFLQVISA